jgi:acetyl/propionyl-CoA carboxylase alpha subunit
MTDAGVHTPDAIAAVLIANRGEVAVRVIYAAKSLGLTTVAVYSEDDADQMHVRSADVAVPLPGVGPSAYLDGRQLIEAAVEHGCRYLHPGVGFLSENHVFAAACAEAAVKFVGPSPETLHTFGDKAAAKRHAEVCGVPTLPGTPAAVSLDEAISFYRSLDPPRPVFVKAVLGGGGRGMRIATTETELREVFARCRAEAKIAFGSDSVYVEALLHRARHIEVQVVGDGTGEVLHLWDRDCSFQLHNQKVIEIAPSPWITGRQREQLLVDSVRMASRVALEGLATFEFLVDADTAAPESGYFFMEANPRLQVEHTVTEEIVHTDLVRIQLRVAMGATLADQRLTQASVMLPDGYAIEARVTAEEIRADGLRSASDGEVVRHTLPAGPGVRVETHLHDGFHTNLRFDPLIAKLVTHDHESLEMALQTMQRALSTFRVDGVATNVPFLQSLMEQPHVWVDGPTTRFIDDNLQTIVNASAKFSQADSASLVLKRTVRALAPDPGSILAETQGVVSRVSVSVGQAIAKGEEILVLEAMKMEFPLASPLAGVVQTMSVDAGDVVAKGQVLLVVVPTEVLESISAPADEVDLELIRPDLEAVLERHEAVLDANRSDAVDQRHQSGGYTARENVARVCDPATFVEIGPLVVAAQRQRRSPEELRERSPADGLVAGIGQVNSEAFGVDAARCAVMAYDYTVFAGTQGVMNHRKTDRLFEYAGSRHLPIVIFAEGGGGRPGDTDRTPGTTFEPRAFTILARLSGSVPLVGVVSGNCFAGNAVMLGLCDVIIATRSACIGLGGPAMIAAGGLGEVAADWIGPVSVQSPNGVVDIVAEDEREAADLARRYLSYFQGSLSEWRCVDQRVLRHIIPEDRRRIYDMRRVIAALADVDTVLELRREFGVGIITCLLRVAGRPVGLIANNPSHLGGAIDADAGDKAARFTQLCDAFGLPLVSLIDNPGFMVGPELEATAAVRHVCRMVMAGANFAPPHCAIVLRKAYGLGTLAMYGGRARNTIFNVAWPTAEFGPMALEGAVRLAYRRELSQIDEADQRQQRYEELLAREYEKGKALNAAAVFEVDDVIDPADTRDWITSLLPEREPRNGAKRGRGYVDTW